MSNVYMEVSSTFGLPFDAILGSNLAVHSRNKQNIEKNSNVQSPMSIWKLAVDSDYHLMQY